MTDPGDHVFVQLGRERVRLVGRDDLDGAAAEIAATARSTNTLRAYAGHIGRFDRFCTVNDLDPWTPKTVADYLAARLRADQRGLMTLKQIVSALARAYRATGRLADGESLPGQWRDVLKGAQKEIVKTGQGQRGEAPALRLDDLRITCRALRLVGTARALRDRAIVSIGFFTASRANELTAFNRGDFTDNADGLDVRFRGRKNSRGEVTHIAIPAGDDDAVCPLIAWNEWLAVCPQPLPFDDEQAFADRLPAFTRATRHRVTTDRLGDPSNAITHLLRAALKLAQIPDPTKYTAHSLRAGLATELAEAGASIPAIAKAGGWRDLSMVLTYASRATRFKDSPLRVLRY